MTKHFLVVCHVFLLSALLLPYQTHASDGFMNDFFMRFPNLPFANMNSLKHIQSHGTVPVRDSLLSEDPQPFKRQIKKDERLLYKSKVLSAPKSKNSSTDSEAKVTNPTTTKYISEYKSTTPQPRSRKRIFYSRPTSNPIRVTTGKPYIGHSLYFNSFAIVATTPRTRHFQSSQKPVLQSTTNPYKYSTNKPKALNPDAKFKELKKSFYFYADKYGSQHFVFPQDEELFDTQITRPRLTSDKGFYAYDPFKQSSVTEEPEEGVTSPNNLHKIRGYHHHTNNNNKKKKGIVIKEKAASGEVLNPVEKNNIATTTTVTTTTTTTTPVTTASTTTTAVVTTLETTPFTTSASTTTLSPASISALPDKKQSLKIDYNLSKEKNINSHIHLPERFTTGIVYSPFHYTPYNFHNFMAVPDNLPPPSYKYSYTPHIETYPKPVKTSTKPIYKKYTYTPYTPRHTPPPRPEPQEVVMPPYTPAPTHTPRTTATTTAASTSPQPQYDTEEFVYYNDGGEAQAFESLRSKQPPEQKSGIVAQSDVSAGLNDLDIQGNNSSSHDVRKQKKYAYRVIKNPQTPAHHSDTIHYSKHPEPPVEHPANHLHIFKDPIAALNLSPENIEKEIIYGLGKPGDKTYSFSVYPGQDLPYGTAPYPPPHTYHPYYPPHPGVPPSYPGYSVLPPPAVYPDLPGEAPDYKYQSKILFKAKSGEERGQKNLFSNPRNPSKQTQGKNKEEEKEEKPLLPQDKIIKATFFEDNENIEILTTPGTQKKYIKKRVRVDPKNIYLNNFIPQSEKLKSNFTEITDFLELENTLEKPTEEPEKSETTLNNSENSEKESKDKIVTPRPKRKVTTKPDSNKFVYFKPNDMEDGNFLHNYVPNRTRFQPTLKNNTTKHVTAEPKNTIENKSNFLPDMKEEMSVSERLKQFMKKAVFKPPAFLTGFSPMSESYPLKPGTSFRKLPPTSKLEKKSKSPKSNLESSNTVVEQRPPGGSTPPTTSPPTQTITRATLYNKYTSNTDLGEDKDGGGARLRLDNPEDLVQLIIQRYKKNNRQKKKLMDKKKQFNEIIEKQFIPLKPNNRRVYQNIKRLPPKPTPVQSLKDKLFGNLFRKLRKDTEGLDGSPISIHHQTQQAHQRLPQNLLHKFGRMGGHGTPPPSSQDSYRRFLKKLESTPSSQPGAIIETSIEKPNS